MDLYDLALKYRNYVKHFKRKETIFEDKTLLDTKNIITMGSMVECFTGMDETQTPQDLSMISFGPGDAFIGINKSMNSHVIRGVARTDVEIISFPDDVFPKLLDEDQELRKFFLDGIYSAYSRFEEKYCVVTCMSPTQRIVEFLCSTQEKSIDGLIHMTLEEIAASMATSRQTVSKIINMIKEDGLLKSEYKVVKLLDIPTVRKLYGVPKSKAMD